MWDTEMENMAEAIDRLTSRHIGKLLTNLGSSIAPVIEQEIKREFRYLADDIKALSEPNGNQ